MSTTSDESQSTRVFLGQSAAERVGDRRRRLLDAAFDLLGTQGAAAVTVRAVNRAADLSPKYFYESFVDRDALLAAVFDDRFDYIKGRIEAAMDAAGPSFEEQARASLDANARCLEEDPRLGRALLRETIADPVLRKRAEQVLPEFVLGVALRTLDPEQVLGNDDPRDLQVAVLSISGIHVALQLAWVEGRLQITREELVDRMLVVLTSIVDALVPRR